MNDNTTFENLSKGISQEERSSLLNKLRKPENDASLFSNKTTSYTQDSDKAELAQMFRHQSFLKKIIIWIKSFFTHTSVTDVLNNSLVKAIAREVESKSPGLIIYSRKVLFTAFQEKLIALRRAASFFRPYLKDFDKEPEEYYFLLGHIIMPDIEKQIETETDPYQFSFNKEIPHDSQKVLLDTMLKMLASIPNSVQEKMNRYVQGLNWLSYLAKAPLTGLISKFTDGEGGKECLFPFVRGDFERLARVMSSYVPLDEGIVDVFRELAQREESTRFEDLDRDAMDEERFEQQVAEQFPVIEMFVKTVPVEKLIKVINGNALYTIDGITGDSYWLEKYTNKWKRLFDEKMKQWQADYQREQMKNKLNSYFAMPNIPQYPYHPWTEIWGGIPFHHELSLGLIYGFMKKYSESHAKTFKIITMEGEFAAKENRHEFNEAVDNFNKVNTELDLLKTQLTSNGEYAAEFEKYRGVQTQTPSARQKIDSIMNSLEVEALDIEKEFSVMCCRMTNLLDGFLSEKRVGRYCCLLNIHRLHNRECDFHAVVTDCATSIKHVYEIIKEIEPLEAAAMEKSQRS